MHLDPWSNLASTLLTATDETKEKVIEKLEAHGYTVDDDLHVEKEAAVVKSKSKKIKSKTDVDDEEEDEVEEQGHERDSSGSSKNSDEVHEHRVLGGYKATLNNAGASDKAKQHAIEVLEAEGIDVDALPQK